MDLKQNLYTKDFFGWCLFQAQSVRSGKLFDVENLAEELESMGSSERKELENRLRVLFLHLLKLIYQPTYQNKKSWVRSVRVQRKCVLKHLKKNPSLKPYLEDIVSDAYADAAIEASEETGLDADIFPEEMPFSLEKALDSTWLP